MHGARQMKRLREPGADYEIRIVGDRRQPLRDFYHALLERPWWVTIAAISGAFLAANALFGVLYLLVGGVAHAAPSFRDAFFFSVQTMGTVGYGAMFPESTGANLVVTAESITGLTLTALATGLVFAKFSRSTARLIFSQQATIGPLNGVPTLSFRLGNLRGNQIVDAQIKVVMIRTEKTSEGKLFYRMLDLALTRQRALSLSRSWNALHVIDAQSPLFGETPGTLAAKEVELQVQVVGLDDATMQTVHAGHRYFARDIRWGHRLADVLSETPDGHLLLDLRRFQDIEPTEPTVDFPYP
ncbi:MAG TPA: ion channel [Polyangia bacterium]|nr:ion channel [Polyangia bacterium]